MFTEHIQDSMASEADRLFLHTAKGANNRLEEVSPTEGDEPWNDSSGEDSNSNLIRVSWV